MLDMDWRHDKNAVLEWPLVTRHAHVAAGTMLVYRVVLICHG